jgi:Flp pilus assembly protein TadG
MTPLAGRPSSSASGPDDEGAATVFVVVLVPALLAMAGLVIDGGYALAARQEAAATAEQAARAGADALARDSLREAGPIRLNPAAATAAANDYLARSGHAGTARVEGQAVVVTVRITRPTAVLSAVGIDSVSSTATASAVGLTGIDGPDLDLTSEATR